MANIDSFRSAMIGGGARANQFRVDLAFPTSVVGGSLAAQLGQFMCKAASLPDSTVEKVSAWYRGRETKLGGERTFSDWTVTIYSDEPQTLRKAFEAWSNSFNNHVDNTGLVKPSDYMSDAKVTQLSRNGQALAAYDFVGVWPTNISQIELDFESSTITTFQVTFAVQRWESAATKGGSGFGVNLSIDTPLGSFGV